jgi:hypothetical protein
MKDTSRTYRVNFQANFNMIKFAFFSLIAIYLFFPVIGWIKGREMDYEYLFHFIAWIKGEEVNYDFYAEKAMLVLVLVTMIPSFILHIDYLICNQETSLTIDNKTKQFYIIQGNENFKYSFSDILVSKIYRSLYYKNDATRFKAPFSDYGYWFLRFNDGKRFFFTSLMIDVNIKYFANVTELEYVFFPSIKRDELMEVESDDELVEIYMVKFKDFTEQELKERIENQNLYQKEAVEACKKILQKKTNSAEMA